MGFVNWQHTFLPLTRENEHTIVGNLGWSTSSETLSAELSKFGTIQSCDTGTERNGRTRGWALVEMATPDEAAYVISACNGLEVEGRPLVVKFDAKPERAPREPREPRVRKEKAPRAGGGDPALEGKPENSSGFQVVVRNLPFSVTSDILTGTFEQIGPVELAEVVTHADSGRSKGWGTVRFTEAQDATDAIAQFGGVELAGRPMNVMMDRYN